MQWLWALNGVYGGPNAMRITGTTATLDLAQTELNESWGKWTAWANLQDSSSTSTSHAGLDGLFDLIRLRQGQGQTKHARRTAC